MKTFLLILIAFTLFIFAPACWNTTPVDPVPDTQMTEAQYMASVDAAIQTFVDDFGPMEMRSAQALEDYTDMTCSIYIFPIGDVAGPLPAFWASKTCEAMNGENWTEWVHEDYPHFTAHFLYNYMTSVYYIGIGCDYMTHMVTEYEVIHEVDIPNIDEYDWPEF